jgi:hypothetical protein
MVSRNGPNARVASSFGGVLLRPVDRLQEALPDVGNLHVV